MKNKFIKGNLFTKKPLIVSESAIQRSIVEYLDARRIINFRINSGKIQTIHKTWCQLAPKGTPDLLAIIDGRAVWVEVKRAGKKPTIEQLQMHGDLRRAGAVVIVADNLQTVIDAINEIQK